MCVVRMKEIGEAGERQKRPVPEIDLGSTLGFKASPSVQPQALPSITSDLRFIFATVKDLQLSSDNFHLHRPGTSRRSRAKNAEDLR